MCPGRFLYDRRYSRPNNTLFKLTVPHSFASLGYIQNLTNGLSMRRFVDGTNILGLPGFITQEVFYVGLCTRY